LTQEQRSDNVRKEGGKRQVNCLFLRRHQDLGKKANKKESGLFDVLTSGKTPIGCWAKSGKLLFGREGGNG